MSLNRPIAPIDLIIVACAIDASNGRGPSPKTVDAVARGVGWSALTIISLLGGLLLVAGAIGKSAAAIVIGGLLLFPLMMTMRKRLRAPVTSLDKEEAEWFAMYDAYQRRKS